MSRVFSGIQPTGSLQIGNLLGSIRNWVGLQERHDCMFCVVDLHSITVPEGLSSSIQISDNTIKTIAAYIACGINSPIFVQSAVSGHSELCWILSCVSNMGNLNRMTQFKEKSTNRTSRLGLYSYPVLMAADILLYHADLVPVGEDQKQHIEFVREVAQSFNFVYSTDYFNLPEDMICSTGSRIMSLRDGTKKMSKSDDSDYSRINLTDDNDLIASKIRKAKTDSILGFENLESRPEMKNLVNIYSCILGCSVEDSVEKLNSCNTSSFKNLLIEQIICIISPIRNEMGRLLKDLSHIRKVANDGAEVARSISQKTISDVKKIIGFYTG